MGSKVDDPWFPGPQYNFGGNREPGLQRRDHAKFCQTNYGVTFQLFEKISVKVSDQGCVVSRG